MQITFRNNKAKGIANNLISINPDNNIIVKQKSEQELTDLLSPILEEDEIWRDKYRYLSLDENGEVYLDMDRYEQEEEGE